MNINCSEYWHTGASWITNTLIQQELCTFERKVPHLNKINQTNQFRNFLPKARYLSSLLLIVWYFLRLAGAQWTIIHAKTTHMAPSPFPISFPWPPRVSSDRIDWPLDGLAIQVVRVVWSPLWRGMLDIQHIFATIGWLLTWHFISLADRHYWSQLRAASPHVRFAQTWIPTPSFCSPSTWDTGCQKINDSLVSVTQRRENTYLNNNKRALTGGFDEFNWQPGPLNAFG